MQMIFAIVILTVVVVGWHWVLTLRRDCRLWKQKAITEEKLAQDERQTMNEIMAHRDEVLKRLDVQESAFQTERLKLVDDFQSDWQKVKDEVNAKEREITNYKLQIANGEKRVGAMYQRIPRFVDGVRQNELDRKRMMMLATMGDDDPGLFTFLSLVDEHEENELEMGLKMGLGDGERQYHAGRAASARDLACAIRDMRWQGQQLVEKQKAA